MTSKKECLRREASELLASHVVFLNLPSQSAFDSLDKSQPDKLETNSAPTSNWMVHVFVRKVLKIMLGQL